MSVWERNVVKDTTTCDWKDFKIGVGCAIDDVH